MHLGSGYIMRDAGTVQQYIHGLFLYTHEMFSVNVEK